jgi:SAM-dependent methyltransferase
MGSDWSFSEADINAVASKPELPAEDPYLYYNPPKELQERIVGQSFHGAYAEAAHFLNFVKETAFKPTLPKRVLDFGCGWGRMLRLLRNKPELKSVQLHGCDVDANYLETVRRAVPFVSLLQSERVPPSPYVDNWFDVIFAYSIFSHLSQESHLEWAAQFARILKPGGRVVLTTQGHTFMHVCRQWHAGVLPVTSPWQEKMAAAFNDPGMIERYDGGEFLFNATHPNVPTYGDAIVPRGWFEKHWGALGFEVVAWDDSPVQNYCTMVLHP